MAKTKDTPAEQPEETVSDNATAVLSCIRAQPDPRTIKEIQRILRVDGPINQWPELGEAALSSAVEELQGAKLVEEGPAVAEGADEHVLVAV